MTVPFALMRGKFLLVNGVTAASVWSGWWLPCTFLPTILSCWLCASLSLLSLPFWFPFFGCFCFLHWGRKLETLFLSDLKRGQILHTTSWALRGLQNWVLTYFCCKCSRHLGTLPVMFRKSAQWAREIQNVRRRMESPRVKPEAQWAFNVNVTTDWWRQSLPRCVSVLVINQRASLVPFCNREWKRNREHSLQWARI